MKQLETVDGSRVSSGRHWKNNDFNGQGIYTKLNGYKYVGQYRNGKRHGKGTHISAGGKKTVGQWKNDKLVK